MKPKIKDAIALVLTRRGRRVHGFAIIWKVLAGVALAAGFFAPSAFADPPEGGEASVITDLRVRWINADFPHVMENDDMFGNNTNSWNRSYSYQVYGQVVCTIVDREVHAPGTIELRVPEKILTGRDGVKCGSSVYIDPTTFTQGWSWRIDAESGEAVIYNTETKSAVQSLLFDIRWTFNYFDVVRVGDRVLGTCGLCQATVRVGGNGSDAEVAQSNAIRLFFDTQTRPREIIVSSRFSEEWDPQWGPTPADAADYVYVRYSEKVDFSQCMQPYEITWDHSFNLGGECIGSSCQVGDTYPAGVDLTGNAHVVTNAPAVTGCQVCLLVRYPKSRFEGAGQVQFQMNGNVVVVSADDHETFVVRPWDSLIRYFNVRPPRDNVELRKQSSDEHLNGGADHLRNGNRVSFNFEVRNNVECYSAVLAPGADPTLASSYNSNQRTNVFEFIDDAVFAQTPSGWQQLTADDYEITELRFQADMMDPFTAMPAEVGLYNNLTGEHRIGPSYQDRESPDVKVWGKFGTDAWELVGTLTCVGVVTNFWDEESGWADTRQNWQFLPDRADASFSSFDMMDYRLVFPENCTGIRLGVASSCACVSEYFRITCSCKPSDFMRSLADNTLTVMNGATSVLRDDQGRVIPLRSDEHFDWEIPFDDMANFGCEVVHDIARVNLYKARLESETSIRVYAYEDNKHKRFDVTIPVSAKELIRDCASNYAPGFPPQSAGVFYVLLPMGFVPSSTPVQVDGFPPPDPSKYDVSITPDWRGTGRALATIAFHDSGKGWSGIASGWSASINGTYSYAATVDYGTTLSAVMAYETGNDTIALGQSDVGITVSDDPYVGGNQLYLEDLDGDDVVGGASNKYLYKTAMTTVSLMGSAESAVSGRVRSLAIDMIDWITGVARSGDGTLGLQADTPYQYQIRSTTADSPKSDIILYDSIENFVPGAETDDYGNPQWRGTLTGVDVSQIRTRGVDPVVYYSTIPGLDIATHTNLADSATWSATAPADLSTVTAVAIDCRLSKDGTPFVLSDRQSLVAILDMRAPSASEAEAFGQSGAHAYNNVYEHSRIAALGSSWIEQFVHDDYTKVGLPSVSLSNMHVCIPLGKWYERRDHIIPVPWTGYTRDGSPTNDIRVDRLVKPTNLNAGDLLLQYANGGVYKAWTLEKDEGGAGVWTPMTTVAQQPLVGGMTNVIASLDGLYVRPDGTETEKRGYGLLLYQQTDTPAYEYMAALYGQWTTGEETVTIGGIDADDVAVHYPGAQYGVAHDTMLANPTFDWTDLNAYPWTGLDNADTIIVNAGSATHKYLFRLEKSKRHGGGWEDGWWCYEPWSGYRNSESYVAPGTGFWYERRAAGSMTFTWPGAPKYPGDGEDHDVWIVDHADAGGNMTHLAIKLEGALAPETVTREFIRELFDAGRIRYLSVTSGDPDGCKETMDRLTRAVGSYALPVPALRNGTGVNTEEELAKGWIWVTVDEKCTYGSVNLVRIAISRGKW